MYRDENSYVTNQEEPNYNPQKESKIKDVNSDLYYQRKRTNAGFLAEG